MAKNCMKITKSSFWGQNSGGGGGGGSGVGVGVKPIFRVVGDSLGIKLSLDYI